MEYDEAVSYLHGLQQLRPKLGTETTTSMLASLDNPHHEVTFVQIAGSNGKGSTARMVERVLREAGLDVGLYTSPHLHDVRERIRINGRKISKRAMCRAVADIQRHVTRVADEDKPTFFEAFTAIALQHFGNEEVDIAVLEVGIGGRYDATSVVDPVASAVTNVSLEHTDIIGETVEEIARDKAQVAPDERPLVTAASTTALRTIQEETDTITVGEEGADVEVTVDEWSDPTETPITITGPDWHVEATIPLPGPHQAVNAGVGATVARQVADVDEMEIERGLARSFWPGRFEVMGSHPLIVLDGAHNPAACETLATSLDRFEFDDLHLVFGAMADKDIPAMLEALPVPETAIVCQPDIDRAADSKTLRTMLGRAGIDDVTSCQQVHSAVELALERASATDAVLIAGSLYVVGEARTRWTQTPVVKGCLSGRDGWNRADPSAVSTAGEAASQSAARKTVQLTVLHSQARFLQRTMQSVGGRCDSSERPLTPGRQKLILTGTQAVFTSLLDRLESREYGYQRLTVHLRRALGIERDERAMDGYPWESGTAVMGILNVTPDSFHDGGKYVTPAKAVRRARTMVANGATIVDVGGESTRPGANPVPPDRERDRVIPVVNELRDLDVMVSVDTRRASVARAALESGADMINDVSGLEDPSMADVVADHDALLVVMHSIETPVDPTRDVTYDDVVTDVIDELAERVLCAERAGLDRAQIVVDPGLGFGKRAAESFELVDRLAELSGFGCPVMVGHSHKSMFEHVGSASEGRLAPTLATTALATERGADIVRVHDVAENAAVVRTVEATRYE